MKKKPTKVEETAAVYAAKQSGRPAKTRRAKGVDLFLGTASPAAITVRGKKLTLDAGELALHAEISTAAARDLGR